MFMNLQQCPFNILQLVNSVRLLQFGVNLFQGMSNNLFELTFLCKSEPELAWHHFSIKITSRTILNALIKISAIHLTFAPSNLLAKAVFFFDGAGRHLPLSWFQV